MPRTGPSRRLSRSITSASGARFSSELSPEAPEAESEDAQTKPGHGERLRPQRGDPNALQEDSEPDLQVVTQGAQERQELDGPRHALDGNHHPGDHEHRKEGEKGQEQRL